MALNVHHCRLVVKMANTVTYHGYYLETAAEPLIAWGFDRIEDRDHYEARVAEAMEWDEEYDALMMAALAFIHVYAHSEADQESAIELLRRDYASNVDVLLDIVSGLDL